MLVGKPMTRVDAYEKASGRAKYTDDLCPEKALVAKIVHSTIAHGFVKSIDSSEAEKMEGVVKVVTCFDVPDIQFPTAGHPYSPDPGHQDCADRKLLNQHVRCWGDDVAVVIAEDEVIATRAARTVKVEYEELPVLLDPQEAMKEGAPVIHDEKPDNVLAHSQIRKGNYEEAIKDPSLIKVEGTYSTQTVQHCHIENADVFAYMESGRIVIIASTQIPHLIRRIAGQALGIDWGKIRVVKPYLGGGFGDKQDALYEPLCAFLTTQVGGRLVKLNPTREETFSSCRVRHAIKSHITSYVKPDGTLVARKIETWSNQGAYGSHAHSIAAKGTNALPQTYPCENFEADAYTVYTNIGTGGAMRGYGMPQAVFNWEAHTEDICRKLNLNPVEYRKEHSTNIGFLEPFSKNEMYFDSYRQCLTVGEKKFDFARKWEEYNKPQTGNIRRGVGCAIFWYNTAVWPISTETSSCRMVMNQDGSIQMQVGETEIGQGADTAYTQMAGETLGVSFENVHIISSQDTDVTPFGTGAYGSRQTYSAGFGIRMCAEAFKQRILERAYEFTRMQPYMMDIKNDWIIRNTDGRKLMSLKEFATQTLYSTTHKGQHMTMEKTASVRSNAYSFGCGFAEVEVDIEMCKVKVLNVLNVHDAGRLINPALAEAQVHGGQSMGIGYALSEKLKYDPRNGRLLNGNLLDYKLSTFMDHPRLEACFVENPEPTSAYGTKALGEPPTLPVAPAIRNAVLQATGVAFDELPMDPHLLYKRFKEEGLIKD